jgi:hypothetical protein
MHKKKHPFYLTLEYIYFDSFFIRGKTTLSKTSCKQTHKSEIQFNNYQL